MRALNSLTFRIFAIFALTLAVLLVLVLMLPHLDSRQLRLLTPTEKMKGNEVAQQFTEELSRLPDYDFRWWIRLDKAISLVNEKYPSNQLFLVTSEGRVISSGNENNHVIRNFIGLSDNLSQPYQKVYNHQEMTGPFFVKDDEDVYYLYMIEPTSNLQSSFVNLLFDQPIILLIFTLFISSPLLLWFSWSLAKPARRLKVAADQVAKGNLVQRPELESSGPIEFQATGASFNKMMRDLDKMMTHQQRLISDISHELRTPLTRLKLAAALMRRRHGESSELERIENESTKLDSMIGELLDLSRNQYTQHQESDYQISSVNNIWKEVLENAKFEAEQLGKEFTIKPLGQEKYILGDSKSLSSALENIIRNAFRYSNKKISITFTVNKNDILIYVDDDGSGVAEDDLPHIFQPFYRTDQARDRISGGIGLGLAIVQAIITQHGGCVAAKKSELGGLCVSLSLPIYQK